MAERCQALTQYFLGEMRTSEYRWNIGNGDRRPGVHRHESVSLGY